MINFIYVLNPLLIDAYRIYQVVVAKMKVIKMVKVNMQQLDIQLVYHRDYMS